MRGFVFLGQSMMFTFGIKADTKGLTRALADFQRKQVPFATVTALNATGHEVVRALRHEMKRVFDRPTEFTLNSLYLKPARKSDMTAWIGVREFAGKGTPAWKYLEPQRTGGPRQQKRFERALSASGISGGRFAVPGKGAQLDSYGNLNKGQFVKMLSSVKAFGQQGYLANRNQQRKSKGVRRNEAYFVARDKRDDKPLGIYQRNGDAVTPVLLFTKKAPSYRARFFFDKVAVAAIEQHLEPMLERSLALALRTARR